MFIELLGVNFLMWMAGMSDPGMIKRRVRASTKVSLLNLGSPLKSHESCTFGGFERNKNL